MEWLVIILLAVWFGVTLVYQLCLRRLIPIAARWDVFRVVPSWHLYTDIPKSHRLYYRDRDAAGQSGEWQQIPLHCSRQPGRALFNPELFASDALFSLIEFLCDAVQRAEPPPPERLVKTVGWQGVWLRVVRAPRTAHTAARQFEVRQQAHRPRLIGETRLYVRFPAPPARERSRVNAFAWLHSPAACVELTTRLAGLSVAVSALEWLVARRDFADDTPLGWPLLRRRSRLRGDGPVACALGGLFCARGFTALQAARLLAGLALLLGVAHPVVRPAALFVATVAACLTNLRQFGMGVIGGDRMRLCVLGALTLRELAPDSEPAARATLWFIAGQCALAYCTSGVLKWRQTPEWRNGSAVGLLMRHEFMGNAGIAAWLNAWPAMNRTVTWGVLALEVFFPLALVGGVPVAAGFVIGAFLMHLGIGHFMGLAPFLWAFLASYPAVLFTSTQVRGWLGW